MVSTARRTRNQGGEAVPEWLRRRASLSPEVQALVFAGRSWTFKELDRAVDQAAARLWHSGVAEGDHVALLGQNSADYVIALCALMRLGAVAVPLNTRLRPAEISWQIADAKVTAILVDQPHTDLAHAALTAPVEGLSGTSAHSEPNAAPRLIPLESPQGDESSEGGEGGGVDDFSFPAQNALDLDDVHGIIYTSGTTGLPKGAMLTYGNHWWNAVGSGLNLGGHGGDVWLAAVPLFHVSGLSIVMRGLIHGFTVLLHERFDPVSVNRAIDDEGVTLLSVVSTMLGRMLQERAGRRYPSSLRAVLVGGGPVSEPLLNEAIGHGLHVLQTYGMTETASQAATLPPQDALRKLGSAGKPLFHVEMRVDAPEGEVGEILVRGPSVSPGYYGRPDESLASRRNGWFCTGDLGFFDDDGYLYVVDRRTDLIISGGENVYPAEVEKLLHSHPAVLEAGVAPKADAKWGQVPVAFVVTKAEPTDELAAELIKFCRCNLASYKAPAEVRFVAELPRNAAGKVARHRLASLLAAQAVDRA